MKQAKRILYRGTAEILFSGERVLDESTLGLVNRYAGGTATPENVYIARMVVCNDQVDHYSTQFTRRALDQIVPLMLGVNIMRNHNEWGSDDLPVARVFDTGQETVGGVVQDYAWIYWERGTPEGDAMARKIALRIWREVSLSWWMRLFTNSVDGKPFDECPYYPGQELPGGVKVIGIMDDVVEVNEVSIVARGGQKNTSIGAVRVDGSDDPSIGAAVMAMRARARNPDHGEADRFSHYFKREKPAMMASFYERLGIKVVSKK